MPVNHTAIKRPVSFSHWCLILFLHVTVGIVSRVNLVSFNVTRICPVNPGEVAVNSKHHCGGISNKPNYQIKLIGPTPLCVVTYSAATHCMTVNSMGGTGEYEQPCVSSAGKY